MRIEETHTSPGVEVLKDEVPKEGALAEASLADDVEVLRPVLGVKQNKLRLIRNPIRAGADADWSLIHGKGARPLFPSPWGASVLRMRRNLEACTWCSRLRPH